MLVFVFALICTGVLVSVCEARSVTAQYTLYTGYSAVDFDSQTGVFSPTVDYCLALSNAAVYTNGVNYNAAQQKCVVLTANNNEILVELHLNSGWNTYVKDISTMQKLVVKYQNAANANAPSQNPNSVWFGSSGFTSTYSAGVATMNISSACNCQYRNDFMDNWSSNVYRMHLKLFKNSIPVSYFAFNAQGSSVQNWFSASNVLSTAPLSTQELRLTSTPYSFSLSLTSTQHRMFRLKSSGSTCGTDSYYIILTNEDGVQCEYVSTNSPWVLHTGSKDTESVNSNGLLQADYMAFYVEVLNRVIIS